MNDFLNNYFKEDVGPIVAQKTLKKIDQVIKENWSKVDLHSNMYNVWIDLKKEEVKITGLFVEDPEITITLKEYIQKLKELSQE